MKEEDEWDSPHIVRFLEALSDEEIEKIKELAKPKVSSKPVDQFKGIVHAKITHTIWAHLCVYFEKDKAVEKLFVLHQIVIRQSEVWRNRLSVDRNSKMQ